MTPQFLQYSIQTKFQTPELTPGLEVFLQSAFSPLGATRSYTHDLSRTLRSFQVVITWPRRCDVHYTWDNLCVGNTVLKEETRDQTSRAILAFQASSRENIFSRLLLKNDRGTLLFPSANAKKCVSECYAKHCEPHLFLLATLVCTFVQSWVRLLKRKY